MDDFIGRTLKNWAAHHRPSTEAREELIKKASLYNAQKEVYARYQPGFLRAFLRFMQGNGEFVGVSESVIPPFTMAKMWNVHMAVASMRIMA